MSGRQNDMLQLLLDLKEEGEKGKQDKAATDTSEEAEEEEGGDAHHRFEADAKLKGMTKCSQQSLTDALTKRGFNVARNMTGRPSSTRRL